MATITGLSGGTSYSLPVGSNDQNGTAQALANAISAALANGSLVQEGLTAPAGTSSFTILSAPNQTYAMSAGQNAVAIGTGGPATVFGSGSLGEQILGDNSNITLALRGGSGSVVLGDGNDFVSNALATTGFNITTGAGNDTILAYGVGNSTIRTGAGTNLIGLGRAQNTVSLNGNDTVFGRAVGGGSETVFGGNGPSVLFPGSSNLYFVGGAGSASVYGGSGSETIFAGTGGGLFGAGAAGNNTLVNAQGGSATLYGAATGDLLYATGTGATLLVAGAGNETLDGSTSSANNTFYGSTNGADIINGGSGADTIYVGASSTVRGGAGADLIVFQASRISGTIQVLGFQPGVEMGSFQGFVGSALTSGVVGVGVGTKPGQSVGQTVQIGGVNSTQISLGNGTVIQFVGVTGLTGSNFT